MGVLGRAPGGHPARAACGRAAPVGFVRLTRRSQKVQGSKFIVTGGASGMGCQFVLSSHETERMVFCDINADVISLWWPRPHLFRARWSASPAMSRARNP